MLHQTCVRCVLDAHRVPEDTKAFAGEAIGEDGPEVLRAVAQARELDGGVARIGEAQGEPPIEPGVGHELGGGRDRRQRELHVERVRPLPGSALLRQGTRDELLHLRRKRGAIEEDQHPAVGQREG